MQVEFLGSRVWEPAILGTNASAFDAFRLCRVSVSGTLPPGDVPEDVRHGASPLFSLFLQLL